MVILVGRPPVPDFSAESSSNTWPRRFMLSRPIQAPSDVRQIQLSPCFPPVELIIRWVALAGGFARSLTAVWARAAIVNRIVMKKMAVRRMMVGIVERRATFRFGRLFASVSSVKRRKGHAAVIGELFLDAANSIK